MFLTTRTMRVCHSAMSKDSSNRLARVNTFFITGGEASLAPDVVIHAVKVAMSLGIDTWLVSNEFWGKDGAFAEAFAQDLAANGLFPAPRIRVRRSCIRTGNSPAAWGSSKASTGGRLWKRPIRIIPWF